MNTGFSCDNKEMVVRSGLLCEELLVASVLFWPLFPSSLGLPSCYHALFAGTQSCATSIPASISKAPDI